MSSSSIPATRPETQRAAPEKTPSAPTVQPLPDHLGCRDLYRNDDRDPFGRG